MMHFFVSSTFHMFQVLTLRVRAGLLLPSISWKLHCVLLPSCFHMNHWQSTVVHTHGWNSYVHFALLTAWLDPLWDGKTLCGIRHWGHPPVSPSIKQNHLWYIQITMAWSEFIETRTRCLVACFMESSHFFFVPRSFQDASILFWF